MVLKRYEPAANPTGIERRVLCRLDADGKLTDLWPGDSPLVLRKSNRILYQDQGTRLWHTRALDGSGTELYADGMPNHGMPALSPDETKVLFLRFGGKHSPELVLFDFGKSEGRVIEVPGFVSQPVWR
jgi:hypothetical protein